MANLGLFVRRKTHTGEYEYVEGAYSTATVYNHILCIGYNVAVRLP